MISRKRRRGDNVRLPADWEVHLDAVSNGRHIGPGTELRITGQRGRYRFIKRVERPLLGVGWIDTWGGPKGSESLRSFRLADVRRVHRIGKTDKAILATRKAAQ